MTQRNHGGVVISLLGLLGVLIVIAGLAILLGSQGKPLAILISIVPIVIGGAMLLVVIKSQKKK